MRNHSSVYNKLKVFKGKHGLSTCTGELITVWRTDDETTNLQGFISETYKLLIIKIRKVRLTNLAVNMKNLGSQCGTLGVREKPDLYESDESIHQQKIIFAFTVSPVSTHYADC